MEIKVLGGGCKSCDKLLANVKEAVSELGIEADIKYITDMEEIMKAGIISTPGLIVDGIVKTTGRVPKTKEIKKILG